MNSTSLVKGTAEDPRPVGNADLSSERRELGKGRGRERERSVLFLSNVMGICERERRGGDEGGGGERLMSWVLEY